MKNKNQMGVIATNKNQNILIYSSENSIGKQALAYLEDSKLFGQVVWIEGIGTLREGFDWVLKRIIDGGYTNVLSICNKNSIVYWAGEPEDFGKSCDFNYLDTYLGIENNTSAKQETLLFPNPSKGLFQVNSHLFNANYSIYNLNGKLIKSGVVTEQISFNTGSGLYFIEIEHNNAIYREKLIVE